MVEIKNTHIYNLEEAMVASGNAMLVEPQEVVNENITKAIVRCKHLASLGGGTGHTNFRTGILVTFDLKYPQYFTKQLQRYHFMQYVSSTSMMHRITKMDFSKCCNKYVSQDTIDRMKSLIDLYQKLTYAEDKLTFFAIVEKEYKYLLQYLWGEILSEEFTREEILYDLFMRIVSNCPMGAELWVHCSTNYEQLATIYKQRKNHKLKEDWGEFCKWIESLPYAKDLIICE